jgi:hypothetical protein
MTQPTRPKRSPRLPFLCLLACALLLGATAAQAFPTPCERTAQRAHSACTLDVWEEYYLTMANCFTIGDLSERRECFAEAAEARGESHEECGDVYEARAELCETLDEFRYDPAPLVDPENEFVDPADIPDVEPANPLLSLEAGLVRVLGSEDEIVVILNTDETREIQGVECRVVAEAGFEIEDDDGIEYVPTEITWDFIAQTADGDLVYCGENTVEYEDGYPWSTDGTFIAGIEFAKSGYLARVAPAVGDADRQEFLLDDAEDWVIYQDLAASPAEEFGGEVEGYECDGGCTETLEGTPLEPEVTEAKFYLPGVGFVLALPFELNDEGEPEWTGEREELLCAGDSLDILEGEDCDIDDPEALLETLCNLVGDWFCD